MNKTKKTLFLSIITSTLLLTGCGGGGGSSSSDNNTTITDTVPPKFTSANSFSINENQTTVATITANESVTFSIIGGSDSTLFSIDSNSGALSFKDAPDYENPQDSNTNNIYTLTIQAKDSAGNTTDQNITVTVTDVEEESDDSGDTNSDTTPPTITSANSFSIAENQTTIATITAKESVTFSKNGGDDESKFNLTSNGVLTFVSAPDFENPTDSDQNNDYKITVTATDSAGNKTDQNITVNVTDVNENVATKIILKTGDTLDGSEGADRSATRSSPTDPDATVSFASLPNTLWSDMANAKGTAEGGIEMTYTDANNYCNNLDFASKTDWRLPTRYELFQVINYGDVDINNSLTDDTFLNFNGGYFWTSNEYNSTHHIAIKFSDGLDYIREDSNQTESFVRCISAPATPNGEFTRGDDNKTVSDSTTNLMWQDDYFSGQTQLSHADAITYCNNLTLGGYSDWRLPNINELHTIVDYTNNTIAFTSSATANYINYFWSSTRSKDDPTGQFYRYLSFDGGANDGSIKEDSTLNIRCVRNQ